jgi:hypothetical protein
MIFSKLLRGVLKKTVFILSYEVAQKLSIMTLIT